MEEDLERMRRDVDTAKLNTQDAQNNLAQQAAELHRIVHRNGSNPGIWEGQHLQGSFTLSLTLP